MPPNKTPEKRHEARVLADGQVVIEVEEPVPQRITGGLIDRSGQGFRAAHNCPYLERGMHVRFTHPYASGTARVIWNRIAPDAIETGFLIDDQAQA